MYHVLMVDHIYTSDILNIDHLLFHNLYSYNIYRCPFLNIKNIIFILNYLDKNIILHY